MAGKSSLLDSYVNVPRASFPGLPLASFDVSLVRVANLSRASQGLPVHPITSSPPSLHLFPSICLFSFPLSLNSLRPSLTPVSPSLPLPPSPYLSSFSLPVFHLFHRPSLFFFFPLSLPLLLFLPLSLVLPACLSISLPPSLCLSFFLLPSLSSLSLPLSLSPSLPLSLHLFLPPSASSSLSLHHIFLPPSLCLSISLFFLALPIFLHLYLVVSLPLVPSLLPSLSLSSSPGSSFPWLTVSGPPALSCAPHPRLFCLSAPMHPRCQPPAAAGGEERGMQCWEERREAAERGRVGRWGGGRGEAEDSGDRDKDLENEKGKKEFPG